MPRSYEAYLDMEEAIGVGEWLDKVVREGKEVFPSLSEFLDAIKKTW
jgi:hypothetical protein